MNTDIFQKANIFLLRSDPLVKSLGDDLVSFTEQHFDDDTLAISYYETSTDQWIVELTFESKPLGTEVESYRAQCQNNFGVKFEASWIIEEDWLKKSFEYTPTLNVGPLTICQQANTKDHETYATKTIVINAALAFGTGHHATTFGCIKMLLQLKKRRRFQAIVDLGTGSGILAIIATKLFHSRVIATDCDPDALAVARDHAHLNKVKRSITFYKTSRFPSLRPIGHRNADLIVANILAGPLAKLLPSMVNHLTMDGIIILSGLLFRDQPKFITLAQGLGLHLTHVQHDREWVVLCFERRKLKDRNETNTSRS